MAAAVVLSLAGAGAAAQTVTVRGGEHDTFTRLVLSIPIGAEWSATPAPSGYRLSFDDAVTGINLSEAFARIPRDRISGIVADAAALDISVVCTCHLDVQLYRPDLLVVDIIDGPDPNAGTTAAAPMSPSDEPAAMAPPTTAALQTQIRRAPVRLPLLAGGAGTTSGPFLPETFRQVVPRSDALAATERAILESFARAATQGVFEFPATLAPDPNAATTGAAPAARPGITPITDPMDGVPVPGIDGPARPGMILRTGIARGDGLLPDGADAVDAAALQCASLGRLDVAAWSNGQDFFTLIGNSRLALTNEVGRVVPTAVLSLARAYIAFGFGREAIETLRLLSAADYADNRAEITTLATLAVLVDGGTAPRDPLASVSGCGPEVAFWSTLARGTLEGTDDLHRDEALIGLRDLPEELRGHLGLRLATYFSEAGEHLVASDILTAARSRVTGGGQAADVAAAGLTGAEHGPAAEMAHLGAIADHNPRIEPQTVTRLLDLTADAGQAARPAVLDMAQSLRFEVDGSDEATNLARAEIRAQVASDNFGAAFDLIDEARDALGDETAAELTNSAFVAITERADDTEFLDRVLSIGSAGIAPAHQNAAAARMLAMGFPDLALGFLGGTAERDDLSERRYLRAEAAAILGDLRGVDVALEGVRDERAQAIRASARIVAGDFTTSGGDLFDGTAADDVASAWRAGNWADLQASDDALLSSASRAALETATAPQGEVTLAARQTLIDEAEGTRAMTQALLERFVVDGEGGN